MANDTVTLFKRYPLEVGQKIRLSGGPRSGDWLVIGVDERKMKLKCPVHGTEVEWDRFFADVEVLEEEEWPLKD